MARRMNAISDWARTIWNYSEAARQEHRSAAFYANLPRREGFEVEEGSAGIPTAFCATWAKGCGSTIGGYAEYKDIPGNCPAAEPRQPPRLDLRPPCRPDDRSGGAGGCNDSAGSLGRYWRA